MEAIGDGGLRHIIAKLTAVARYVGHIEHCIAFLEFRSPAVATNRLVGMHQQHRHTDLMPPRFQPALRTVDSLIHPAVTSGERMNFQSVSKFHSP